MAEKTWNSEVELAKKRFVEPFREHFDDNTLKIRRNLLVTGVVATFYKLKLGSIDTDKTSLFGVRFTELDQGAVDALLFLLIAYFLIHFVWCALEDLQAWRFRLTGLTVPKPRNSMMFAGKNSDAGGHDQKQLTLGAWWSKNIQNVRSTRDAAFDKQLASFLEKLQEQETLQHTEIKAAIHNIKQNCENIMADTAHVTVALARYEKGFLRHQQSQAIRWILLEFGLPVVLGLLVLVIIGAQYIKTLL